MKIKGILLDFDDTVYDYWSARQAGLKAAHKVLKKRYNISFDDFYKKVQKARDKTYKELADTPAVHDRVLYFQKIVEKVEKNPDPSLVINLFDTYWRAFYKKMKLLNGALAVLKELKRRKLKVALVSNHTTDVQLRKINVVKIAKYIDVIVTSEESGTDKPHPSSYLLALKKLKLKKNQVIMVGDAASDIEGANRLGIITVQLLRNGKKISTKKMAQPDFIIGDIKELLKILDN